MNDELNFDLGVSGELWHEGHAIDRKKSASPGKDIPTLFISLSWDIYSCLNLRLSDTSHRSCTTGYTCAQSNHITCQHLQRIIFASKQIWHLRRHISRKSSSSTNLVRLFVHFLVGWRWILFLHMDLTCWIWWRDRMRYERI